MPVPLNKYSPQTRGLLGTTPARQMGSWMNPTVWEKRCPLWQGHVCTRELSFNLHEHARRHDQPIKRFDRARGRFEDIDDAFMRPHLELFAALLVDMRAPQHRIPLDPGRNRNRT